MTAANQRRNVWIVAGLAVFAVTVLVAVPFIGTQAVPLSILWRAPQNDMAARILWQIRIPRVLTAFLAGATLAVSGMVFQAMFRNPLATPFTLGVSGGASFGAALYVRLGLGISVLGVSGVSLFAFCGALLSLSLVYGLTRLKHGFSTAAMLLAGIGVSLFFSSLILFIQYLSDFTGTFRILHWLMGGLNIVGYRPVINVLPFSLAGILILAGLTHELNLLLTGDDLAMSRGVDVPRLKKLLFVATSLMVGGVVAFCGPIGFVGMMVPHICRLMVGANHRTLLPASILFGGAFLVACDALARTLIAPAEIPVGVLTALLGGPFFIWLLMTGSLERGGFE